MDEMHSTDMMLPKNWPKLHQQYSVRVDQELSIFRQYWHLTLLFLRCSST
eukprot:m.129580 g.129580  ORF g.129580 m.129580 type:complete len:50 (+) comp52315_c0_seq14:914-1063(+)